VRVERRPVGEPESRRANGPDWDRYADEYQATHGPYLGDAGFLWGPEGLTEDEAGILGDVAGKDVLEVGSGAGQCSRWVRTHGGRGFGIDLSFRQLQHSRRIDGETGVVVPAVLGTATALPFADDSFDLVISITTLHNLYCYDFDRALREIERVGRGNKYICIESYRNEQEKANLLYWQVTCEMFCTPSEWDWWFRHAGYTGDHSFIYFE